MTGLALGLAAGFAASLLRRRAPGAASGYLGPVPASGPRAVPPLEAGPVLHIVRNEDASPGQAGAAPGAPAAGEPSGEDEGPSDPGTGAVLRIRLPGDTAVG